MNRQVIEQAGELRSSRIESIRGVAALAIVVAHAFIITHGLEAYEGYGNRVILGTGLAVFLFFVLSGYLLFWPFVKRDYGDGAPIDIRTYAANRLLRIMPLYYIVMVVVLVFQEDGSTLRNWILFSTWTESFSMDTVGQINGVVWSVVVELHYYTLLPLLAWGIAKIARGSVKIAAIVIAAGGTVSLITRVEEVHHAVPQDHRIVYSLLTTFMFLASGMLLALLRLELERRRPKWLDGFLGRSDLWIVGSTAIFFWACDDFDRDIYIAIAGFLLVGACVLPLQPGPLVRAMEWRWLATIGVASYSLYLWHLPLMSWWDELDTFPELLLVGGGVSVVIALVSYRLIEAPFLRLRKRWSPSSAPTLEEPADPGRTAAAEARS